jgi:hypothetical protein
MLVIAGLAAFIPAPVFAQSNDLIKQEDYYAPTTTVVRSATPQELNEFSAERLLCTDQDVVQQPTTRAEPGRGLTLKEECPQKILIM